MVAPGAVGWTSIEEHNIQKPKPTVLRISPNPFRRFTNIIYQISDRCEDIVFRVYDITGRKVRDLTDQVSIISHQSSVKWNGTDDFNRRLPSGVYFLKLTTGGYTTTEKLLLIR